MMKTLQAVVLMVIVATVASCSSSRQYQPPPPRHNAQVSLIMTPNRGFTMSRNPDGRFYHRSPQGFVYWQGYDNRFYLDRAQVKKVRHSNYEYREWKRYGKKYSKRGRY